MDIYILILIGFTLIAINIVVQKITAVYYLNIINSHMDHVIKMLEELIEETVKKGRL